MKLVVPILTAQIVPGAWCGFFMCPCCGEMHLLAFGYAAPLGAMAAAGRQIEMMLEGE